MAPQKLAHVRIRRGMSAHDERLRRGIEPNERVAAPLGHPDSVGIVDIHGVRHRAIAGQLPLLPGIAVEAGDLSRIPFAHPHAAIGVAPDAPRALARRGWHENGCIADLALDAANVTTREGRVVDVPVGAGRDAIWTGPARRVEDRHRAAPRIEPPEDAVLSGEPEGSVPIEGRSIEARVRTVRRKREALDLVRYGIDPDDGVETAVGYPRCAVGPDDHAVRSRPRAELDCLNHPEPRIEPSELARELRRVPDAPVPRRRDVVRSLTARDGVLLHDKVDGGARRAREGCHDRRGRVLRRAGPHHHAVDRSTARDEDRCDEADRAPPPDSSDTARRRSEFDTTVTDESAIAAAASTGDSSQPVKG